MRSTRDPDPGISEGVCSIIYAAPRIEVKGEHSHWFTSITVLTGVPRDLELHILRDMLMHKYGRDFSAAAMENRCSCVSERVSISSAAILNRSVIPVFSPSQVMRKLVIETPSDQLVDAYLSEIAKAYSVKWASAPLTAAVTEQGVVVRQSSLKSRLEAEGLFRKDGNDTPESLPLYSREIFDKLPDIPPTEDETDSEKLKPSPGEKSQQPDDAKEESEDEFAVLTRRFQELKKR